MISGRSLRPPVCSCLSGCCSREEMLSKHGTPTEFEEKLADAIGDGMISPREAQVANFRYREEWERAPKTTKVEKP